MKRTKIKYSVMSDGMIRIDKFENVADREQLFKEFGNMVLEDYRSRRPCYEKGRITGVLFLYDSHKGSQPTIIDVGDILSKEHFSHVIVCMKKAGENLQECRDAVKVVKVEEDINQKSEPSVVKQKEVFI